ncbi:MAG: AP2 domain-containing protein [Bacteroidota bacterium]
MSEHRNITRIDIEPSAEPPRRSATHGWQVRVRRNGARHTKFFSDSRHGTPDAALGAAISYRDTLLDALPDATPPSARRAWSNTGVSGLSLRTKAGKDGDEKLYVQLSWIDADSKRRGAAYSVAKWGLRRALWNGCLRLYREHEEAGRDTVEPHLNFATAQETLSELLEEEQRKEDEAKREEEARQRAEAADRGEVASLNLDRLAPVERMQKEEKIQEHLESKLFGK